MAGLALDRRECDLSCPFVLRIGACMLLRAALALAVYQKLCLFPHQYNKQPFTGADVVRQLMTPRPRPLQGFTSGAVLRIAGSAYAWFRCSTA